jgi:hypothetical protein
MWERHMTLDLVQLESAPKLASISFDSESVGMRLDKYSFLYFTPPSLPRSSVKLKRFSLCKQTTHRPFGTDGL